MSEDRGYRVEGLVVGTRRDGKRRYDESAKARLIGLCMQPGASVAAIAVSNGLNPNVVRRWVEQVRSGWLRPPVPASSLLPVIVSEELAPSTPAQTSQPAREDTTGTEFRIEMGGATVRFTAPLQAGTIELITRGLTRC